MGSRYLALGGLARLACLKRVLSKYKTLIVNMSKNTIEESKATYNLMLLYDVSTLFVVVARVSQFSNHFL